MSIDKPNYTQIPNTVLGDIKRGNIVEPGLMATLEGSQLKVLLAISRLTFGYHQETRRASLSIIESLTGLSRQGVINAANRLEELGLITRKKDGGVTLWQVVVNSVDQLLCEPVVKSVDKVVKSVDQASQMSRLPSKKETIKETIKEKGMPRAIPALKIYYEITGIMSITKNDENRLRSIGDKESDLKKWDNTIKAWLSRGYYERNITGMLDWFNNGIPERINNNGKPHNDHKPSTIPENLDIDAYQRLLAESKASEFNPIGE